MSVNKVMVLGRLGKDPELKYTPGGAAVCNFSVACDESYTDKQGQKHQKTEWVNVVVWGKLAELCNQYLAKGRQAFVEGKLSTRSWEDKDGKKCYKTEVLADTVQFIGGAPAGTGARDNSRDQGSHGSSQDSNSGSQDCQEISNDAHFASDDIPF